MTDAISVARAHTVVLLTDFGLTDPYVGQMKGVLHTLAPQARIMDLSHGVPAYRVETGAFFLASAYRYFPPDTVFVAVVDPWVGTDRDILILSGGGYTFVGPDNGILILALETLESLGEKDPRVWRLKSLPAAYAQETGLTFAGRDVMAPLAARLCQGADPASEGATVNPATLVRPIWATPERTDKGILASVLHVDHFGNAILNLANRTWLELVAGGDIWLLISSAGAQAALQLKLVPTYAELPPGKAGLVAGGQGYLELAMCRASAATELSLKAGDLIHLGLGG